MTSKQRRVRARLERVLDLVGRQHGSLKAALMVAEASRNVLGGEWVIRYEPDGKIIIERVSNSDE